MRRSYTIGQANVTIEPLVDQNKMIFPPLYIKLGLMKQIVKAQNKEGKFIKYLRTAFPSLSEETVKQGIFDGLQISKIMKDVHFAQTMVATGRWAW